MKSKSLKYGFISLLTLTISVCAVLVGFSFFKKDIKPAKAINTTYANTRVNESVASPFDPTHWQNVITAFDATIKNVNGENIRLTSSGQQIIVPNIGTGASLDLTTTANNAVTQVSYVVDSGTAVNLTKTDNTFTTNDAQSIILTEGTMNITLTYSIGSTETRTFGFTLNVLNRNNYALPTTSNINLESITQERIQVGDEVNYVDKVVYSFNGNIQDYFSGKTTNPFPILTFPNNLSITSATYMAPNSTTNTNLNNQTEYNVNDFGTYTFTVTYNGLDNRSLNITLYSFGSKNMYRGETTIDNSVSPIDKEFTYNKENNSEILSQTSRVNFENGLSINSSGHLTTSTGSLITLPTFVKTNQVPVWINNFGTISNRDVYFSRIGTTTFERINLTRLSESGRYVIAVNGNAPSIVGDLLNDLNFTNYYAFEITSSNPVLNINAESTYTTYNGEIKTVSQKLSSSDNGDSFTNGSVTITRAESTSPFDKPYEIWYRFSQNSQNNFGEEQKYNGETLQVADNTFSVFEIKVKFGTQQSFVIARFTIDKTPINIIPYFGKPQNANTANDSDYTRNDSKTFGILDNNSVFYLNNLAKASGASVTATVRAYTFSDVVDATEDADLINAFNTPLTQSGSTYILAKYKHINTSKFNVYNIGQVNANGEFTKNSQMGEGISAAGFYEFEILDSAYNTSFYYVFLDNFTPQVIHQTDATNHEIIYGDYKAILVNDNFKLNESYDNVIKPETSLNVSQNFKRVVINGNNYLTVKINTPDSNYPNIIPNGWNNSQQLRVSSSTNIGPITNNGVDRQVLHDRIVINKTKGDNEGTYNFGVRDVNGNNSNSGTFAITFDLADVKVYAKTSRTDVATNNYFNDTFTDLTKGSEVTGTSFNVIEFGGVTLSGSTPVNYTLTNLRVDFYKKLTSDDADFETNYFSKTVTNSTTIYNRATSITQINEFIGTEEGKYVFTWNTSIPSNPNNLYPTTRSQYIIVDRSNLLENASNARLTFQEGANKGNKQLSLNQSNVNKIYNGLVSIPNNVIADTNLTPVKIKDVGLVGSSYTSGIFRVDTTKIIPSTSATDIDKAIADLFRITTTIEAKNNGSYIYTYNNFNSDVSSYVNKAKYNVILSDGLNKMVTFANGKNALGEGVTFNFNINRISPSANFVDTELSDNGNLTDISKNILSLNSVNANNYSIFDVTAIDDSIASIKPNKTVYFMFDKNIVYNPSISTINGSSVGNFNGESYPYNAEIDLTNIEIRYNGQISNTAPSVATIEQNGVVRYYIQNLDTSLTGNSNSKTISITLKYKGSSSDFLIPANSEDIKTLTKTYTLYIDNLAPSENLSRIQKNDSFYDKIKNHPNVDSYFFGLDPEFEFTKPLGDDDEISETYFLDSYKMFYRNVEVPISGVVNKDLKTISEDSDNASNYDGPIFNESNSTVYKAFNHNVKVSDLFSRNTIYEIVELDLAGNLTSYFVCLRDNLNTSLTLSVQNYKNSQNTNVLTSDTLNVTSKNQTALNIPTIYSADGSFAIESINSIDSFFEFQIYNVTDAQTESDKILLTGNTNPIVITSNPSTLTDEIKKYFTSTEGMVYEIKIRDRLAQNAENENSVWLTFKVSFRPNRLTKPFDYKAKETDSADIKSNRGYIYSTVNEQTTTIHIVAPEFNSSYGYTYFAYVDISTGRVYEITPLSSSNPKFDITDLNSIQDNNFRLEAIDIYGEFISTYFSSIGDYANFETTNNYLTIYKNTAPTQTANMLDKLELESINFYSDNLTFNYHTAFRDGSTIKLEVCENPFASNTILDFKTVELVEYNRETFLQNPSYAIDLTNGVIYFPKTENMFYLYRVTTTFTYDKNEQPEVIYGAYYTKLPILRVTDSYDDELYFRGDENNTIRSIYANVSFNLSDELLTLVDSQVLMSEKNFFANGEEPATELTPIQNNVSLRVYGTKYIRREFTFKVQNKLGNSKTFLIIIDASNYPVYQFEKVISGNVEVLLESSIKFNATLRENTDNGVITKQITGSQYFTNDFANTDLVLAQDKVPALHADIIDGIDPKTDELTGELSHDYTIYHIVSNDPSFVHDEYVKITYVARKNNLNENNALFNQGVTMSSAITSAQAQLTLNYNSQGPLQNGVHIGLDYYAEIYVNNSLITLNRDGNIILTDAGVYSIVYRDISGNTHTFNLNSVNETPTTNQTINLLNKILFNVTSDNYEGELIESMALENYANVSVANSNIYGSTLNLSATYNGNPITISAYQTLDKSGVYEITASGQVGLTTVTSTYRIYLVKPNEQRLGLEFVINNLNNTNSKVTSVIRRDPSNLSSAGSDVTNVFRSREGIIDTNAPLTRLRMSNYESGNGLYTVYVNANYGTIYKPNIEYSFKVLILDTDPLIKANVNFGSETSKTIVLSWVASDLFANYGELDIQIGDTVYNITANDMFDTSETVVKITQKGDYNIDIKTPSGMILTRYTITKNDPINTVGIILIVVGAVALVVGVLLFFKLRTKMKVK